MNAKTPTLTPFVTVGAALGDQVLISRCVHHFDPRGSRDIGPTDNEAMRSTRVWRATRTGVAGALFLAAQLIFFVLWLGYLKVWMHWTSWGLIIGMISTPGVIIFPILYWIVEGSFPLGYFLVWAVGLGLGVASAAVAPSDQ